MTEFRTDAAFSTISGTHIPTSEYLNNFLVTRRRNGQIQSVEPRFHEASLKHHRLVHDLSVFNFSFPVIAPQHYNYNQEDNGKIFLYTTRPVNIFNGADYTPDGDAESVTVASAVDDNNNSVVYFKVDSQFNYYRIDENTFEPSDTPTSYAELSNFSLPPHLHLLDLDLPDGLFIGQQLSIVRSDTNTISYIVHTSDIYTPIFVDGDFSENLLIIVWNGSEWKKLTLT